MPNDFPMVSEDYVKLNLDSALLFRFKPIFTKTDSSLEEYSPEVYVSQMIYISIQLHLN